VGAIVAKVQLERIDSLVKQECRGRDVLAAGNCDAFARLYYKPTFLSNVHPTPSWRNRKFSGRACRDDLPHPARSGGAGQ